MTSILVKALGDLLQVKLHNDISGKDEWYKENQPKAWQQAREALSLYSQSEGKTKEEILDGLNITTPLNELEGQEIYSREEVLAAMEEYTQQFQSKENEGKQAGVFVKASERMPEYNKLVNGKLNGRPALVKNSNLAKGYMTANGNLERIVFIEWLDESIESGERGEVERLKGEIERLKEKIEILEIGNKRVDINSPF